MTRFADFMRGCLLAGGLGLFTGTASGEEWEAPAITEKNLEKWLSFVRPNEAELAWQKVRWHGELEDAAAEAMKLQRPVLLWTMNGHPCGET